MLDREPNRDRPAFGHREHERASAAHGVEDRQRVGAAHRRIGGIDGSIREPDTAPVVEDEAKVAREFAEEGRGPARLPTPAPGSRRSR
jgi:hypothetical protein